LRRDAPYGVYGELKVGVPIGRGYRGTVGDCYDRFWMRGLEVRESIKILRQALAKLPAGETRAKVLRNLKVPAGEAYGCVEGARGEIGFYVVADGSDKPYRLKIRSGSFASLSIIEHISRGLMIADLVAVIATLDVLAPEMDR
jgi:NADH-quinone oxidoreductase subunit D